MDFERFITEIEGGIKDYLPEEVDRNAECFHRDIVKNNNIIHTGLSVVCPEKKASPIIYMEPFYKAFKEGSSMDSIFKDIAELLNKEPPVVDSEVEMLCNFSAVKDRVIFRLINKDSNIELLSDLPHRYVADLALIYCICLNVSNGEYASAKITNSMLEAYGTTEEELYELAVRNTPVMMPMLFQPIGSILERLLGNTMEINGPEPVSMFVATNKMQIGGAGVVLYEGFDRMAREAVGDYYILPSSTEEVIIVPKECGTVGDLRTMVCEVNHKELSPEQVLSESVYEFVDGKLVAA